MEEIHNKGLVVDSVKAVDSAKEADLVKEFYQTLHNQVSKINSRMGEDRMYQLFLNQYVNQQQFEVYLNRK